jgi:hypothetical protein
MSRSFTARLAWLPKSQRELWPLLAPLAAEGMVLHGGTAIALRLGHRISVDFDFFTERPLDRDALLSAFPQFGAAAITQDEPNTYTGMVPLSRGEARVSFFGGITFGRIGDPETTDDGVAVVASLQDLMAQKLKVVMQRVEAKDYRDIAAMIRAGVSLGAGTAGAMALFGVSFSAMDCAKALVHFKGGDLATIPPADREVLLKAVRSLRFSLTPAPIRSTSLSAF